MPDTEDPKAPYATSAATAPAAAPEAPALLSGERLAEIAGFVDEERTTWDGEPVTKLSFWPRAVDELLAHVAALTARLTPGSTTERAPTVWAYDQACAAIEKQRARAEQAEARLAQEGEQERQLLKRDEELRGLKQRYDYLLTYGTEAPVSGICLECGGRTSRAHAKSGCATCRALADAPVAEGLVDACEHCAHRQPEDAELPCPRCGNGIYKAMSDVEAYELAKRYARG
jgi:hypothetical protein